MIQRPCYATREEVRRAIDVKQAAYNNDQIDRAIVVASESVDDLCKRSFFPMDTTKYFDWPSFQMAYPWRVWLDRHDLVSLTALASGGTNIPLSSVFLRPENAGPPFTWIELNRSKNDAFGNGPTPQKEIAMTGTWGYWLRTWAATTLAAIVSSTTATTLQVGVGGRVGVGDTLVVDSERMIVQDKNYIASGQVQIGTGCSTASPGDNGLAVADGTQFAVGDILLLDAEWMNVLIVNGNELIVKRAWDGSVLVTHNAATIYAARVLTVTRGDLGTTAATHSNAAPVNVLIYPALVKELAIAEASYEMVQEPGAWATSGGRSGSEFNMRGQASEPAPGAGIPELRDRVCRRYGRKARQRVV